MVKYLKYKPLNLSVEYQQCSVRIKSVSTRMILFRLSDKNLITWVFKTSGVASTNTEYAIVQIYGIFNPGLIKLMYSFCINQFKNLSYQVKSL